MTLKSMAATLLAGKNGVPEVERACVAAYLDIRGIPIPGKSYLNGYLADVDANLSRQCRDAFGKLVPRIDLETLIELFELLMAGDKRKKNGVAYTPLPVKQMMLMRVLRRFEPASVFDPSCGCASFLLTAAQMIHARSGLPYGEIVGRFLFGADIDAAALEKTRALFALLLAENGEDCAAAPKLFQLDMLDPESVKAILVAHPGGFNCVVGNPPYVRFRNMDDSTKAKVGGWMVSKCGNADMYMPFFEVGMSLVAKGGVLNIVHDEDELPKVMEKAIFPYSETAEGHSVIEEPSLRRLFPCAYRFLEHCRALLDRRDKGKGDYPAWYAYGRTQGMNCRGFKLLIPYIAGKGTAVLSDDPDLLFYCGYALISDDLDELRYIKAFLESDAFWYYLCQTSKPYSKGFMALAKNYIVRFSIPALPGNRRCTILSATAPSVRNRLVWKAYGLDVDEDEPLSPISSATEHADWMSEQSVAYPQRQPEQLLLAMEAKTPYDKKGKTKTRKTK